MSKFIELTTEDGKSSINIAHIVWFRQHHTDVSKTIIHISFGEILIAFKSYEEVKRLVLEFILTDTSIKC